MNAKICSENRDLRAFLNDGFDNNSNHPVDSSFLPRYDMESGQLLEAVPSLTMRTRLTSSTSGGGPSLPARPPLPRFDFLHRDFGTGNRSPEKAASQR